MKVRSALLTVAFAASISAPAFATTVVLNFEGIASPTNTAVLVGNYYNGGGGPNYGISFTPSAYALCLNTPGIDCSNTSRGGLGSPTSQSGGLIFLNSTGTYMDDAAGFTTGFSLFYSAPFDAGSLAVYSGVDGTGTLLASLGLPTTTSTGCSFSYASGANYCPFVPVGVAFSGTAESILFSGVADYIVFDDVSFGSVVAGQTGSNTPEPSSFALLLTGAGAVATQLRRLKRAA